LIKTGRTALQLYKAMLGYDVVINTWNVTSQYYYDQHQLLVNKEKTMLGYFNAVTTQLFLVVLLWMSCHVVLFVWYPC